MSRRRWKDLDRGPSPAAAESPDTAPGGQSPSLGSAEEAWRSGQALLRESPAAAARRFEAARELLPPSPGRAEQVAACYIAQAVAYLSAGALDAAQLSFTRLRGEALPPAAGEFARGLFELAQELRHLDPAERREALEPLLELVLGIRLPYPLGLLGPRFED
jgi:hypothetical protein